jgi:hypothetical protein
MLCLHQRGILQEGEFIIFKDNPNAHDWYCAEIRKVLADRIEVNYYTTVTPPLERYAESNPGQKWRPFPKPSSSVRPLSVRPFSLSALTQELHNSKARQSKKIRPHKTTLDQDTTHQDVHRIHHFHALWRACL